MALSRGVMVRSFVRCSVAIVLAIVNFITIVPQHLATGADGDEQADPWWQPGTQDSYRTQARLLLDLAAAPVVQDVDDIRTFADRYRDTFISIPVDVAAGCVRRTQAGDTYALECIGADEKALSDKRCLVVIDDRSIAHNLVDALRSGQWNYRGNHRGAEWPAEAKSRMPITLCCKCIMPQGNAHETPITLLVYLVTLSERGDMRKLAIGTYDLAESRKVTFFRSDVLKPMRWSGYHSRTKPVPATRASYSDEDVRAVAEAMEEADRNMAVRFSVKDQSVPVIEKHGLQWYRVSSHFKMQYHASNENAALYRDSRTNDDLYWSVEDSTKNGFVIYRIPVAPRFGAGVASARIRIVEPGYSVAVDFSRDGTEWFEGWVRVFDDGESDGATHPVPVEALGGDSLWVRGRLAYERPGGQGDGGGDLRQEIAFFDGQPTPNTMARFLESEGSGIAEYPVRVNRGERRIGQLNAELTVETRKVREGSPSLVLAVGLQPELKTVGDLTPIVTAAGDGLRLPGLQELDESMAQAIERFSGPVWLDRYRTIDSLSSIVRRVIVAREKAGRKTLLPNLESAVINGDTDPGLYESLLADGRPCVIGGDAIVDDKLAEAMQAAQTMRVRALMDTVSDAELRWLTWKAEGRVVELPKVRSLDGDAVDVIIEASRARVLLEGFESAEEVEIGDLRTKSGDESGSRKVANVVGQHVGDELASEAITRLVDTPGRCVYPSGTPEPWICAVLLKGKKKLDLGVEVIGAGVALRPDLINVCQVELRMDRVTQLNQEEVDLLKGYPGPLLRLDRVAHIEDIPAAVTAFEPMLRQGRMSMLSAGIVNVEQLVNRIRQESPPGTLDEEWEKVLTDVTTRKLWRAKNAKKKSVKASLSFLLGPKIVLKTEASGQEILIGRDELAPESDRMVQKLIDLAASVVLHEVTE